MNIPTQEKVLATIAGGGALPDDELDYYTAKDGREKYDAALALIAAHGWRYENLHRQTLVGGTAYETFTCGGVDFCSPRGYTPLTDAPTLSPLEALAAKLDGPVIVRIDGVEAEIDGPVAEGLRAAVLGVAGRPLPSRETSRDDNVVAFPAGGRMRLVAPHDGDAS